MKKNLAFTLAETLIVIGIIGVVAALTLPNLNHATGDKEKVTKVKKIYSALTDAFDRAEVIYGPFDEWYKYDSEDENYYIQQSEIFANRLLEFMKVQKICEQNEAGCFNEDYVNTYNKTAILSDGISLAISCDLGFVLIFADIDGPNKGKNQKGYDIFAFHVTAKDINDNQIVHMLVPDFNGPELNPNAWSGSYVNNNFDDDVNVTSGYYTAWVIENGNLDYLKCPEQLNWETKTSCE